MVEFSHSLRLLQPVGTDAESLGQSKTGQLKWAESGLTVGRHGSCNETGVENHRNLTPFGAEARPHHARQRRLYFRALIACERGYRWPPMLGCNPVPTSNG